MKRFIFILVIGFILIGFNEVKSFDNTKASIKAINETTQACTIDMQKDKGLICD